MEQYHKIISTCCYVKEKGKILMLYRNKLDSHSDKRIYRGVGGKAEQGESPFDCVKREVKEEAGIDINPVWKGFITFSDDDKVDWEVHVFTADGYKGELKECNEGELFWIDEENISNLEMPEADRKLTPLLFKEGKFHAHAKYGKNSNLIGLKIEQL